jgi:signal transduction histidine kinase
MPGEDPSGPAHGGAGCAIAEPYSGARAGILRDKRLRLLAACLLLQLYSPVALAETPGVTRLGASGWSVGAVEVMQLAMFAGVMGAALLSAIWLIRERARIAADNLGLRARVADLGNALQRSDALLNLGDQRIVVWTKGQAKPELVGSLDPTAGAPEDRGAFLAFGRWLTTRSATLLERAISALRGKGESFELIVETLTGSLLEVQGRQSANHVAARFVALSKTQKDHARLKAEHEALASEYASVRNVLEVLPMPFWLRRSDGRLRWVNRAFANAVDAKNAGEAIQEGREFLGTTTREAILQHHLVNPEYAQTVPVVVGGDRRVFAVTDVSNGDGSAGLAVDRSEIEAVREELRKTIRSHSETLDQLTTAVAIFDAREQLRFFNQAFQKLWGLDLPFLESAPGNGLLLDRLRSDSKLAEQPEWRRWKENLLAAYRAVEPQEHWWHLPDGRTIRVVANPHPAGGVTWVFENLTERIDLESRYNAAVKVQGETLDNLAEGVAVFGPDGRLRLSNPAFARLWGLSQELIAPGTHISTIRAACELFGGQTPWSDFVSDVTGFDDERRDRHGQVELGNGSILRYAVIQLPNGQVMMTFVDVTDTVNVERALKEMNDALQRADQLKNDFVQHVSYELRSPLTNIMGFTELLALPATGPLNPRQRDYVDHIGSSSAVLLAIVNDILDLATVDAGIMELELTDVAVEDVVRSASDLVADRLREEGIVLRVDTAKAPPTLRADEHRLRQILFNLLSNAANYAPTNSSIALACRAGRDGVEISVHDDGPGIPPDVLDTVFRRFESRANGGRRRGAGLGLAIVKSLVELHGGSVRIETAPGRGTTVVCSFPSQPDLMRPAAE